MSAPASSSAGGFDNGEWLRNDRSLFSWRYDALKREEASLKHDLLNSETMKIGKHAVPGDMRGRHFQYQRAGCFKRCFDTIVTCMTEECRVRSDAVREYVLNGLMELACMSIFVFEGDESRWELAANNVARVVAVMHRHLAQTSLFDPAQCIVHCTASGGVAVYLYHRRQRRGSRSEDHGAAPDIFVDVAALNVSAIVLRRQLASSSVSADVELHVTRLSVDDVMTDLYTNVCVHNRHKPVLGGVSLACECGDAAFVSPHVSSTVYVRMCKLTNGCRPCGRVIAALKLCCGVLCVSPLRYDDDHAYFAHMFEHVVAPLMFPGALERVHVRPIYLSDGESSGSGGARTSFYGLCDGSRVLRMFDASASHLMYVFLHPSVHETCFAHVDEFVDQWDEIDYERAPPAYRDAAHLRTAGEILAGVGEDSVGCVEHTPSCCVTVKHFDNERVPMAYVGVLSLAAVSDRLSDNVRAFEFVGQWQTRCERPHLCRCSRSYMARLNQAVALASSRREVARVHDYAHAFMHEHDSTFVEFVSCSDAMCEHAARVGKYVREQNDYKMSLEASTCRVIRTIAVDIDRHSSRACAYKGNYRVLVDGVEFGAVEIGEGVLCRLECDEALWVQHFAFCIAYEDPSKGGMLPVHRRVGDILSSVEACRRNGIEEFEKHVHSDGRKSFVQFRIAANFVGEGRGPYVMCVCFGYNIGDEFFDHGTLHMKDCDKDADDYVVGASRLCLDAKRARPVAQDVPPSPSVQDAPLENENDADTKSTVAAASSSSSDERPPPRAASGKDLFARELLPDIKRYGLVFLLTTAQRIKQSSKKLYCYRTPLTPVDAPKAWHVAFVNVGTSDCVDGLGEVDSVANITAPRFSAPKMRIRGNAFYSFALALDKNVGIGKDGFDDWPRVFVHSRKCDRVCEVPSITAFDEAPNWSYLTFVPGSGNDVPSHIEDDEVFRSPLEVLDDSKRVVCRIFTEKRSVQR